MRHASCLGLHPTRARLRPHSSLRSARRLHCRSTPDIKNLCSIGGSSRSILLDTLLLAETFLENNERLENAIEFLVHDLERSLHLVKWEGMGRHKRWIDTLHLQHTQEAFHTQTTTRTQTGRNRLFRHPDSPFDARDMHKITMPMIAHIGDRTACFGDFDCILEGAIGSQCLDCCIHPLSISQIKDPLNDILFGEINNDIGSIGTRKFLPTRNRFDPNNQSGSPQLRTSGCHQSYWAFCKDRHSAPDWNTTVLCPHEAS